MLIHPTPTAPSFAMAGLTGYQYEPLLNKEIELHRVDVHGGHDTFIVSKALTRIYYVISGRGTFEINREKFAVRKGFVVEVPPGLEYTYSGRMQILLISQPRWFPGNEETTRHNPDVARARVTIRRLSRIWTALLRRWKSRLAA